ncbi:sensor histidine kinase [Mangrovicoccus algicola]|uniref:histidine kinase n=1 Tax=Mangrovicoccus algicola TaxID=2771008 RepID=A0A8J6YSJ1_9RHOB|nr:sensor histidine kinase [Mangrovicoccus algicola]MBE3636745.1 sensor histidine kinase [Mangrovicoccus algicola]
MSAPGATVSGSLRRRLFLTIIGPLILITLGSAAIRYHQFAGLSQRVYDNTLLTVALTISRDVMISEGDMLKTQLLTSLTGALGDTLYYRIVGPDGAWITGYSDAPPRPAALAAAAPGEPQVYDSRVGAMPVRVLSISEAMHDRPLDGVVTVEVWTTVNQRRALSMELLGQTAIQFAAILAAAAALLWFGIHSGLRPLRRLEEAILARSPQDLQPIRRAVPAELSTLVAAMNGLFARLDRAFVLRDAFISDSAHQIRTPVAAIQARAEACLTAPDEARLRQRVAALAEAARAAGRLVNQLLSQERVRGRELRSMAEPVDLAALMAATTRDFAAGALSRGIDVSFDIDGDPRPVTADPVMLGEMLTNLLENAVAHGGAGGWIAVTLRFCSGEAVLEVADRGPGIAPALRERVFDRFFRAAPGSGPGAGLGLAIVRDIARAHGGDACLAGTARGCTIRVSLRG